MTLSLSKVAKQLLTHTYTTEMFAQRFFAHQKNEVKLCYTVFHLLHVEL